MNGRNVKSHQGGTHQRRVSTKIHRRQELHLEHLYCVGLNLAAKQGSYEGSIAHDANNIATHFHQRQITSYSAACHLFVGLARHTNPPSGSSRSGGFL